MITLLRAALAALLLAVLPATALANMAPPPNIEPDPMSVFAPFAGKTWRGTGPGPDGKPITDTSKWEFILGGKAVQSTHRIAENGYGGTSVIFYDAAAKTYIYHYFTNAGFHTQGVMTVNEDGSLNAVEQVAGHATVAEARSTVQLVDGKMVIGSTYVNKDGSTAPGHSFTYEEAPDAKVEF